MSGSCGFSMRCGLQRICGCRGFDGGAVVEVSNTRTEAASRAHPDLAVGSAVAVADDLNGGANGQAVRARATVRPRLSLAAIKETA